MKSSWKAIAAKATIWLVIEILLNVAGLDNLADYSEFIFGRDWLLNSPIVMVNATLSL